MSPTHSMLLPPSGPVDLLVIAAECSGDEHGGRIIGEYLQKNPGKNVYAIGGDNMARATPNFLFNLAAYAAMGFVEVIRQIPFFFKFYKSIVNWIVEYRPKRICFIDSPSLNLRIVHALYKAGVSNRAGGDISIYYYVAPQVWAWKESRKLTMAREIDSLAVLFPFEKKVFADTDLPVVFTGHPFTEPQYRSPIYHESNDSIFLLPGSRRQCIQKNFPTMLKTFELIREEKNYTAICLYPSAAMLEIFRWELKKFSHLDGFIRLISVEEAHQKPVGGRLALVVSGTMSFQCALAGIPGLVMYKMNPITHWIGRRVLKIPFIAMANLLLGYECYGEYIQGAANPEILAQQLKLLINARQEFATVSDELFHCLSQCDQSIGDWISTE